ncbi:hypothetical protein DKX38_003938 [Salix brachista]|uniref:Protein kinase domain-containing protein n=1 Tax=Salix brachista TaxID=2182728 RepID=A0A5N5N904_9ROSI|nr:hypothetical protein DKX38_003938 [Salix brachista]
MHSGSCVLSTKGVKIFLEELVLNSEKGLVNEVMSREQKRGNQEKGGSDVAVKVVVAVKASKEIPKTALVWALTHVVQPGDCITLLVVVPSQSSVDHFFTLGFQYQSNSALSFPFIGSRRLWGFPRFTADCANGHRKSHLGATSDQKFDITDSCSQMILQLHDVYDPNKINVKIKIVSGSPCGAVSEEAKKAQANWVVLDKIYGDANDSLFHLGFFYRQLRHEEKCCMEELQCNIVVMKKSQAKVLRLNLVGSSKEPEVVGPSPSKIDEASEKHSKNKYGSPGSIRGPVVTPTSSPELGTPFTLTEAGTSSVSSDPGTSPFFISDTNGEQKKEEPLVIEENRDLDECSSDTDIEHLSPVSSLRFETLVGELPSSHVHSSRHLEEGSQRSYSMAQTSTTIALLEKFTKLDQQTGIRKSNYRTDVNLSGNMREAISLSRNVPLAPPPLCSICQHKAPVFGKPPRWFSYAELELATGGFSQANFLAEGGFGSVHRGVLPDGQAVAVKQHKLASSQGDIEFCSEVEVLSCAQHRNVVMLLGFCIEDRRRLLVYEYICNGSLDSHLYGCHREPLEWSARQKIAVGAARGLRYLHEECRVGCIVHRDLRPNNILITHDFEPLKQSRTFVDHHFVFMYASPLFIHEEELGKLIVVGDFGLARWQPDGETGVETRARPLLEEYAIDELIDPQLGNHYSEQEVYCMLHAALLCIRRDPHSRPRMSKVLRILEGDMLVDTNYMATPGYDVGNRSGRIYIEQQQQQQQQPQPTQQCGGLLPTNEALEGFSGKLSFDTPKPIFMERDKARRISCQDS